MAPCRRLFVSATLIGMLIGLVGCGNSRFGSELPSRLPRPHTVGDTQGTVVRLPEAEQFSIALPKVTREAGLTGSAAADAHALKTGNADANATVAESGTATGSFQLGHSFENATERQADWKFTVLYDYSFTTVATPATPYPDAQIGLRLYARDGHGRLLRDLTLLTHSTENGSIGCAAKDEKAQFTLTLAPGESVSVFLAGQVYIAIREGRSAQGALSLSNLRMEVETHPAPAVQSSADEQG